MQTLQQTTTTFNSEVYKALKSIALSALTKAGLPEGSLYEKTGFILVPRANGTAIGVYYTQTEHTSLDDYQNVRGERLRFYSQVLERAGFSVKKVPYVVPGTDPCLEAVLR